MDIDEGPSVATAFELFVRSGASAAEVADTVASTWRQIEASLVPIIGPQGVTVLYQRSFLTTGRSHAWLRALAASQPEQVDVSALVVALAQRESSDAALVSSELLQTFYRLVNGLIGAPLTYRLLGFMWQIPRDPAHGGSP